MTGNGGLALLADAHTSVPSEAVGSGLGVWWLLVAALGLLTVACGVGFVLYLRRTSPRRRKAAADPPSEPALASSDAPTA